MGIRPLDLADWLEVDDHHDAELALKAGVLADHHDAVVAVVDAPGVDDAAAELWELVAAAAHPDAAAAAGALGGIHAVERCGRATQEDWVLLVEVDGELVIAAACVCFPTRWELATKVGLTTRRTHAPVAFYDDQLGDPVDRFLARLTPDRPVWRANWNLTDDPDLHQPVARADGYAPRAGEPFDPTRVWLRVERQTLRRLPRTGAVAFSIRIHQHRLDELAARPDGTDVLGRLAAAVARVPAETAAYKGLDRLAPGVLAWIGA